MNTGGIYSAVASVCWILCCAATARMDRKKFRSEEKQEEQHLYEYYRQQKKQQQQQQLAQQIEHEKRVHPRQVLIQKEVQHVDMAGPVTKKRKVARQEQSKRNGQPTKPKPLGAPDRSSTAETANLSSSSDDSDSDSSSSSSQNDNIMQDLNSMNKDPRYIPMLPNATPMSTKSLNKKSKNLPKISENDEPITPKQSKSSKKKSNNMSKSSSANKQTKNRDPPGAREPLDDKYYEL